MDSSLSHETIKRLIAQQRWIQNSLIISFALSLLVGLVSASSYWYFLNLFDTLLVPVLIAAIGIKQRCFTDYAFERLLSFELTLYVFGKLVTLACYIMQSKTYFGMGIFIIAHVIYFTGEFLFVLYCHYLELTWDSFLINQSWNFDLALVFCLVEYAIEHYFFPSLKGIQLIVFLGILFNFVGQFFRLGSFFSAKSNFHHRIQWEKSHDHELVTTGLYSISRHPGYLGWFLFSIGNQLLLVNPVSFVLFIPISWYFFYDRIAVEEIYLEEFFGNDYIQYRNKVPTRIPFIDYLAPKKREEYMKQYQ